MLECSKTLYHLDLSYNKLNAEACGVIAEGLRNSGGTTLPNTTFVTHMFFNNDEYVGKLL